MPKKPPAHEVILDELEKITDLLQKKWESKTLDAGETVLGYVTKHYSKIRLLAEILANMHIPETAIRSTKSRLLGVEADLIQIELTNTDISICSFIDKISE